MLVHDDVESLGHFSEVADVSGDEEKKAKAGCPWIWIGSVVVLLVTCLILVIHVSSSGKPADDTKSLAPTQAQLSESQAAAAALQTAQEQLSAAQAAHQGELAALQSQLDLSEQQKQELADEGVAMPWPDQQTNFDTVTHLPGSPVYQEVDALVQSSRQENLGAVLNVPNPLNYQNGDVNVLEVVECRNRFTKTRFEMEKKFLEKRGVDPNVKQLFHGSGNTSPTLIAKSGVGLDNRRGSGYYGAGVYTGTNFDYSHQVMYRHVPDASVNEAYMIVCDVLCGNVKDYHNVKQYNLTFAPAVQADSPYQFDSVKGTHDGTDMYIVYDFMHVYAKYVVKYDFQS